VPVASTSKHVISGATAELSRGWADSRTASSEALADAVGLENRFGGEVRRARGVSREMFDGWRVELGSRVAGSAVRK
jgi:hypothetical protein